eukprot:1287978-Rhodomonas_salina.1
MLRACTRRALYPSPSGSNDARVCTTRALLGRHWHRTRHETPSGRAPGQTRRYLPTPALRHVRYCGTSLPPPYAELGTNHHLPTPALRHVRWYWLVAAEHQAKLAGTGTGTSLHPTPCPVLRGMCLRGG